MENTLTPKSAGFCCPSCKELVSGQDGKLFCRSCNVFYPYLKERIPSLLPAVDEKAMKRRVIDFWGKGWKNRLEDHYRNFTKEQLVKEIEDNIPFLEADQNNLVLEMRQLDLEGKKLLEIGCGSGAASSMLALAGAQVTAVDITPTAPLFAQRKFDLLGVQAQAMQADAENLPFPSNSFDIIYSNGVLHHTPDIERAVREVHRVLKPGGEALIMLYARGSFQYWVQLFLWQGILQGRLLRSGREWLGNITEGGWITSPDKLNPMTRVYSKREARQLFSQFEVTGMRKNSFFWSHMFPGLHRLFGRKKFSIWLGVFRASALEKWIGSWAGFCLNIRLKKRDN